MESISHSTDPFGLSLKKAFGSGALAGNQRDFSDLRGSNALNRTAAYHSWQNKRQDSQLWSYTNAIQSPAAPTLTVSDCLGEHRSGINYASQDYLSLSSHPAVKQAAHEAIERYGIHSAGSAIFQGNTALSLQLEQQLAEALSMEHVVLFPTGWSAGYTSIKGLMRPHDHIILDRLAHNCLANGAYAATTNIHRANHLDVDHIEALLKDIRSRDAVNAIMVVTEGLFSMDADTPDLARIQALCEHYNATHLVDVAHDFGALGPGGTGSLGERGLLGKVDLVMGSFSKTFASNGGFLGTNNPAVKQYLSWFGPAFTFSNALSPVQAAVVGEALRIVRSAEGDVLRSRLMSAICGLREALEARGIEVMGVPSPIVPVLLGNEGIGRIATSLCFRRGLFTNLVEFPAVPVDKVRYRMQVMASHTPEQGEKAAQIIQESLQEAARLYQDYAELAELRQKAA